MNTTARSIFAATTAISLVAISLAAAFSASTATPLVIGLLTIFALTIMMVKSYTPRRIPVRATLPRPVVVSSVRRVRVPAMVEYPVCRSTVRAA